MDIFPGRCRPAAACPARSQLHLRHLRHVQLCCGICRHGQPCYLRQIHLCNVRPRDGHTIAALGKVLLVAVWSAALCVTGTLGLVGYELTRGGRIVPHATSIERLPARQNHNRWARWSITEHRSAHDVLIAHVETDHLQRSTRHRAADRGPAAARLRRGDDLLPSPRPSGHADAAPRSVDVAVRIRGNGVFGLKKAGRQNTPVLATSAGRRRFFCLLPSALARSYERGRPRPRGGRTSSVRPRPARGARGAASAFDGGRLPAPARGPIAIRSAGLRSAAPANGGRLRIARRDHSEHRELIVLGLVGKARLRRLVAWRRGRGQLLLVPPAALPARLQPEQAAPR